MKKLGISQILLSLSITAIDAIISFLTRIEKEKKEIHDIFVSIHEYDRNNHISEARSKNLNKTKQENSKKNRNRESYLQKRIKLYFIYSYLKK